MNHSKIQLTILLLVFLLIGCQSDIKTEQNVPVEPLNSDIEKTSRDLSNKISSQSDDSTRLSKVREDKIVQEKLAKLGELKQKKEELRIKQDEEAAKKLAAEEKLESEKRRKRRKAREEKRRKEEAEKKLLASQSIDFVANEEPLVNSEPQGKLQFLKRSHDFGKIFEGDTFEHEFKFYNSSQVPVVISNVKASCGCTKTTFPKEPIMPGENGTIGVTFDSKGKLGRQKPFMSVVTNGDPSIYSLYMDGTVDTERE